MAQSFIQRLLGIAPIEEKAQTGSGWIAMATEPSVSSLSASPNKLMAEAEALFHSAPWVAEVERIISGRMGRVPYHLEDADGETLTRKMGPLVTSLLDALDHPSPRRTRRELWSLTGRHKGLAGNGFWFLDQRELLGGTPLDTQYINPVRMTYVEDSGSNLLGWIMDHPQNPMTPRGITPTPFGLDEIIHHKLDEPDSGHWGIGIPESAYSKIEISRLTDRHTGQVLVSGARLAGLLSPKTGVTIGDDGWQAIVRDYRNIMGDPDSAKRLQVLRSPVDFTKTAADPSELQLNDLLTKSRDDTFALWGVPLSQAGIVSSRGLNSGDIPQFEEAALWQGPIEERLSGFREKVQREFIDRWAKLGLEAILILDTPSFDDDAPRYLNAKNATIVPLTNNERRALVGKDPLEDEGLGEAIFLDQTMVQLGLPEPVMEVAPQPIPQPLIPEPVKASPLQTLRARMEITWEPRIRKVVQAMLAEQRNELASRIQSKHSHLSRKPTDTAVWWNTEREQRRMRDALEPLVLQMAGEVARRAEAKFPVKAVDAEWLGRLQASIRLRVGQRIHNISETTRDDIARLVEDGIGSGLSPVELGATIREATAFNEARAELISRTETMFAYNDAALSTYGELGASEVQAIDGDLDDECAFRDGRTYSVEEAFGIQDHPNGTLDWVPIVPQKAEQAPGPAFWAGMEAMAKAASVPLEIPVPIVHVAAPSVNVAPPDISPFTAALERIEAVLSAPKPTPVLKRDENGRLIGIGYE